MSEQDTYKKRLELALEAAGLDLWENDLITGDVPYRATKTFVELGYDKDEIAVYIDDLFQVIHQDDVPIVKAAVNNHLTGITPQYRCEFRIRAKNGAWVWYANYGRIMDSNDGVRGHRFIGVTFNIDDRRRKEEELELINCKLTEQNALIRRSEKALLESQIIAGLGTYALDITTGVWESSDVLDRLFGIKKTYEHTVKGWAALLHPDDRTAMTKYFENEVLGQGKPFDKEYRIIRHDDQVVRWFHGLGKLEFDAQGSPIKMLGTIQDITERKHGEAALNESMRKLEEKESAKTRFLAAAGHDLRQPLAAANLFIDALKFTKPTPDQNQIVQRLEQAMSTFNELLDALLNMSKLDAGMVKPAYTTFNVAEIFNWVEQRMEPLVSEKHIRFNLYYPTEQILVVRSDLGLLKSVLMNLITNAVKFTSKGVILVSARRRGSNVLFQVWDTGIGIADEQIGKIFDEFYQIDNPQRDRTRGLGLGLSIAKRALAILDGQITCRSKVGHGSVFGFCLPLGNASSDVMQQVKPATSSEVAVSVSYAQSKRFVVLEDDALVSEALTKSLEMMGGKVKCFHSAEFALQHANIEEADYYIVDYMLGSTLNGIEFLNLLRQKLSKPIKAVLMTGDTSTGFIRKAEQLDWPVLHKPVNMSKLFSSLNGQG